MAYSSVTWAVGQIDPAQFNQELDNLEALRLEKMHTLYRYGTCTPSTTSPNFEIASDLTDEEKLNVTVIRGWTSILLSGGAPFDTQSGAITLPSATSRVSIDDYPMVIATFGGGKTTSAWPPDLDRSAWVRASSLGTQSFRLRAKSAHGNWAVNDYAILPYTVIGTADDSTGGLNRQQWAHRDEVVAASLQLQADDEDLLRDEKLNAMHRQLDGTDATVDEQVLQYGWIAVNQSAASTGVRYIDIPIGSADIPAVNQPPDFFMCHVKTDPLHNAAAWPPPGTDDTAQYYRVSGQAIPSAVDSNLITPMRVAYVDPTLATPGIGKGRHYFCYYALYETSLPATL